ncbi:MAG: lactoylglutathione lyase [Alphaproteobacteria bacterium]|jgi:lactoylglutathione lyase
MNDSVEDVSAKESLGRARLLHTMLRVRDLDKSIDFYTRHLGMKLLRRRDDADGKYTLVFVGYGEEADTGVIELTYNWDREEGYELGTAYGHIAIGVPNVAAVCEALAQEGVKISVPPKKRPSGNTLAFIEDPDGYRIELLTR